MDATATLVLCILLATIHLRDGHTKQEESKSDNIVSPLVLLQSSSASTTTSIYQENGMNSTAITLMPSTFKDQEVEINAVTESFISVTHTQESEQVSPDLTQIPEKSNLFEQNVSTVTEQGTQDTSPAKAIARSNNEFATQLYQAAHTDGGNILLSPFSVGTVLSMLWLGAEGNTAQQIAQALHLPQEGKRVKEGYQTLFHSLQDNSRSNVTLKFANKLYLHNRFILKQTFPLSVSEYFLSDVELVDFASAPNSSRNTINQWIENATDQHLQELLNEDVINSDTKVIIVNAIYFKGLWKTPFSVEHTRQLPFHLSNGSVVYTNTMLTSGVFATDYIPRLNCTVIRLPYEGYVSLVVLLPHAPDGLPVLEKELSLEELDTILNKLDATELHLAFPKFTIEFSIELESALKWLGIEDMFDVTANLSGITDIEGLSVNHIIHKTFLEVTEEGSQASAATVAVLDIRGGTPSLTIDHPFLFTIRDDKNGVTLFLGSYQGPE